MKNTLTSKNHISQIVFGALFFLAFLFICIFFPYYSKADETGYVDASELNVRTGPVTWAPAVGTLSYTSVTIVGEEKDADGDLWYKIKYAGGEYYVYADYVTIQSGSSDAAEYGSSSSFEEQLSAFPESYQKLLRDIHASYPNYIFEADYVNISYDDAVYQESIGHRKLVNIYSDGVSWRSLDSGCYNSYYGTWNTYSGDWTDAGIDVIEYYMDPRNFLNTRNMFIFAQQTYSGAETRSGVETIAAGSFLAGNYTDSTGTHSYVDTIMEAARESNVSPYVIAATIRAEQPTWGQSSLIDGSYGYYNFFNFGASGSDVVGNGINFAKTQGWDTVYKSILGGAKGYYNGYLKAGQDTYFYKDYNLPNLDFNHQYAQSVYDQIGNAAFLRNAIGSDYNAVLTLRIPVYTEMPLVPQGYPEENGSLNKRYAQDGSVLPRGTQTIAMVPNNTMVTTSPVNDVADDPKKVTEQPATPVEEPTTTPPQEEPTTHVQTATYSAGDANGDGKSSTSDYVAVKKHIIGAKIITDPAKLQAADANGDGKISTRDYVRIKKMIIGR